MYFRQKFIANKNLFTISFTFIQFNEVALSGIAF